MSILFTIDLVVAASTDRVFAALVDFDHWGEWMPNLVRLERLNDKPFGPGFEWREVRRMFGREAAEVFEVTALEPDQSLSLRVDGRRGHTGRGEFLYRHDLIPKGGLTQLSLQCEIHGLGRWGELLFRLMGGVFKRAVTRDMVALKRYVERPRV